MTNTSVAEILGETEMKETQKRCQLANQLSGRLKISNEEQLKPQIQKYLARAKSLQEELRADPKNKDKRVKTSGLCAGKRAAGIDVAHGRDQTPNPFD
jgi:hypothetical protein